MTFNIDDHILQRLVFNNMHLTKTVDIKLAWHYVFAKFLLVTPCLCAKQNMVDRNLKLSCSK